MSFKKRNTIAKEQKNADSLQVAFQRLTKYATYNAVSTRKQQMSLACLFLREPEIFVLKKFSVLREEARALFAVGDSWVEKTRLANASEEARALFVVGNCCGEMRAVKRWAACRGFLAAVEDCCRT